MLKNKGTEWALSCATVSAAILLGMSTTVHADAVCGANNTNTVEQTNTNDNSAQSSLNSVTTATTQSTATTQASNNAITQQSSTTPVTQSANAEVPDGGSVSDDFSNEAQNQLGYASNFHIFANEATLNTHTNGNVAVGDFYGNVNFGTNVKDGGLAKEVSYIQRPHNISSSSFVTSGASRYNKVVFGDENEEFNNIDFSNSNRPTVNGTNLDHVTSNEVFQDKDGNQYIDIANYLDGFLSNRSNSLTKKTPQVSVKNSDFPDRNQRVINLEDYEVTADNKIVIDLDADVLNTDTPLIIAGLSNDKGGTNIIINVDTKGQNPYDVNSQIKLIYSDGSANSTERPNQETEYFDDNHLLWNFYDSTSSDNLYHGQINVNRPFQGSVLAPKATVDINANLDGNIAADKVNVHAETHRWDFQDDSDIETEYEFPVTIPGELPELPGEEENNGGNIEHPDEEEKEEDIDPDTGGLVEGGSEGEDENGHESTDEDDDDDAIDEVTDEKNDEDTDDDTGDEGDTIIHGGSENTDSNGSNGSSESDLNNGLLPGVVGNNKDESQTPTTNAANSGSLPQTGETTGIMATIIGLIMLAFGVLLKATHIRKED